jgi:beta-glucosidase
VPDAVLTTPDGKPGLKADYNEGIQRGQPAPGANTKPIVTRTEANVKLTDSNLPAQIAGKKTFGVQWSGFLTPTETGDFLVGLRCQGFGRLTVNGKLVATAFGGGSRGLAASVGRVHLEKGHKVELEISYGTRNSAPHAELIWAKALSGIAPEAIAAARNADVVIAVVGITSQLEGEEMPVNEPGFLGGDRTSIDLPQPEEELVEGIAAIGKPLAVVLMNGSALAVNWINEHANAVLEAWYPGEEGGAAVAETLSGKNNPAGRLPVTFYTGVDQLPNFEDYGMANRTYRYFAGKPLYPFGYGLSYTTFGYSNLTVPQAAISAGDPLNAAVTVTNTGKVAGDEVVQLYLKFPEVPGAPIRALRGFQRIHLEPGANQKVEFHLNPRDLSMVTESGDIIVSQGRYTVSIGGGQPGTGAPSASGNFEVNGQIFLPE